MLLQAISRLLENIGVPKIDASWSASRSRGELFLFYISIDQALLAYIYGTTLVKWAEIS